MKRLFFGLAALGLILGLFAYAWSGRGGFWSAAGRYRFRFSAIRSGVGPPDSKTARYTPPRTALSRTGSASEPLSKILSEPDYRPDPTQPHPLLGQPATDFTLEDDQSNVVNLRRLRQQGPVVLIFYYGYSCNNCVAQLFGMDEDLALFRELGAQVIAVSADPPEMTAERFNEYGRFGFRVLSDPGHRVAQAYGAYRPASRGRPEAKAHATFLIDTDGHVFWVNYGPKPYLNNETLLFEIAQRNGLARPG